MVWGIFDASQPRIVVVVAINSAFVPSQKMLENSDLKNTKKAI